MAKKIVFYICIGIILVLCTYSIYLMHKTDANYKVSLEENDIVFQNSDDEIYVVGLEEVTQSIDVVGNVVPVYADERVEIFIEGKLSDINKRVQIGSVIEKDAVYAVYGGKEYKANSKMRCIGIKEDSNGVMFEFIDYSKLYIEVRIPEKYASEALCNKGVTLVCNGNEFLGNISFLDAYCVDGYVTSNITYKNEEVLLRPGTECNAVILTQQKENVVAVPLEYVIYSEFEDEYKLMIVDGEKTITKTIKIGIIGDKMIEIVSGVNENDCIMIPKDEMSLRYYLNNSQGVMK